MHFAEKRVGQGGEAEPVNAIGVNIPYPLNLLFDAPKTVPDAQKYKGKIQSEEDFDSDSATGVYFARRNQHLEENAEHYEKYPDDNVTQTRLGTEYRCIRATPLPHFSDFKLQPYIVGYDVAKQTLHWWEQWKHCEGSLGEDHPTCKKASWYYTHGTPSVFANHFEELDELGHFDASKKYGIKSRPSFLPKYQPVKANIPGAYEFYNSKKFLEEHHDEEGLPLYPFCIVD